MNDLQIFENANFGTIRTLEENGKALFCAKDVAAALGYRNPNKAIGDHCRGVTKRYLIDSLGRKQETNFLPEGDIYRLAAKSELPGADKFESWIFDEVLPTIRKHGAYMTPDTVVEALRNPDTLIEIIYELKKEQDQRKLLEEKIEADKPKIIFSDALAASKTSILIGELAKLIKQNGVDIGQNRLFEWMRNNSYLIRRKGSDYNMPTQYSMERGLFEIKETAITHSDGHVSVNKTPKVTGKGQQYFVNIFLAEKSVMMEDKSDAS